MKPITRPSHDDCIDQASDWGLRLAAGRLSPHARADFEAWRAEPRNAAAFDEVIRTWHALEEVSVSPDLIDMRRSALEAFGRGQPARWGYWARRWSVCAALGACFVAMATGWALWIHFVPHQYETGRAERRVVLLDDGSRLSLDAQSRVDVRYSGDRRELWLRRGRARFDVTKDLLRPFSVSAADKMVVATGTEFSVEILASQVHVILYKGSVEVLADQLGRNLQPVQLMQLPDSLPRARVAMALTPGKELIATVAESVGRLEAADPVRSSAWEAGQLVFSDEPLAAAVERMNRYADSPLSIGDAAAGQIRISGVYVAGDVDAFIEGITGVFPVRVREIEGHRSFVSAR